MDHHPYVFLLGGRDLEMITIKRMLKIPSNKQIVCLFE
jgi:hypothetical protein